MFSKLSLFNFGTVTVINSVLALMCFCSVTSVTNITFYLSKFIWLLRIWHSMEVHWTPPPYICGFTYLYAPSEINSSWVLLNHYQCVPIEWIPLTFSLSVPIGHHFWSVLQTTSSVCTELMKVAFAGWPKLIYPCVEIHCRMLLMSLFSLLQQWPECLAHLPWGVCEIGVKWLYKCCFKGFLLRFVQTSMQHTSIVSI